MIRMGRRVGGWVRPPKRSWIGLRELLALDLPFLLVLGGVQFASLFFLFSFATPYFLDQGRSPSALVARQLLWILLGWGTFFLTVQVPLERLRGKTNGFLFLGVLALLFLTRFSPLGVTRNGATRWLNLGPVEIQPSQLAQVLLILYLAAWLPGQEEGVRRGSVLDLVPAGILFTLGALLIFLEPDLGTTLVFGAVGVGMLFLAGYPPRRLALGLALFSLPMIAFLFSPLAPPYQRQRLLGFFNPLKYPDHSFQQRFAYLSILRGGLLGVGLGRGVGKFSWIPTNAVFTDAFIAALAEEKGLIGVTLALGALLFLYGRIWRWAERFEADSFRRLLGQGIVLWLLLQTGIHVGVNFFLLPYTGINLPFFSYGGSATLSQMLALGLAWRLRIEREAQERAEPGYALRRRREARGPSPFLQQPR